MDSLLLPTITPANISSRTQPVVCAQCFRLVPQDFVACTREGYHLDFCTLQCCHDYWNNYGFHNHGKTPSSAVAPQTTFQTVCVSVASRNEPVVCSQCFRLAQGDFIACTKDGLHVDFCTYKCCSDYWNRYGLHHERTPPLAVIPQGTRVHDYCVSHLSQQSSAVAKDGPSFEKGEVDDKDTGAVFKDSVASSSGSRATHSLLCRFPGCREKRRSNSRFCCSDHAKRFNSSYCLFGECTKRGELHNFCSWDHFMEATREGMCGVVNIPTTSGEYKTLQRQFVTTWCSKKGKLPGIRQVLRIVNPALEQRFNQYVAGLSPDYGDVEQYYHGTQLKCDILEYFDPCTKAQCGICGIARKGFDPQRISSSSWQRFGKGFYFAANSSKAYEYPLRSRAPDTWTSAHRYLLVCDIAPGRKYILHENNPSLKGPPRDYDSVYGKVCDQLPKKRSALNYDELVVYKTESIRPHYILVLENTLMVTD